MFFSRVDPLQRLPTGPLIAVATVFDGVAGSPLNFCC